MRPAALFVNQESLFRQESYCNQPVSCSSSLWISFYRPLSRPILTSRENRFQSQPVLTEIALPYY
jgi:hypothetical protein